MNETELRQLVADELEWEPSLAEEGIGIGVGENGVITLSGHVKSYYERSAAEECAKRVGGVTAVVNDLEISLPGMRDDTSLAEDAVKALALNTAVPAEKIMVMVNHGWITLEGSVNWDYQRRAAERAVRDIIGVRGVTNKIEITPSVRPFEIEERIRNAFQRHALVDASHVQVTTDDSNVILSGLVGSWQERIEAERQAWSAPGVTKVENKLRIATTIAVV